MYTTEKHDASVTVVVADLCCFLDMAYNRFCSSVSQLQCPYVVYTQSLFRKRYRYLGDFHRSPKSIAVPANA